jgi:putative membrane protein
MSYLNHWSFDPFGVFVVVLVVWHEIGLARLARSDPQHARTRRLRSVAFYAGLAVVLLAVDSAVEYFADRYFFMHMTQHLLLMFAAPSLLVAGAPWQPLADAVPRRAAAVIGAWSRPLRPAGDFVLRPWVTVVLFNAVMLFWHIPAALDLAENNPAVKIWLLHSSYLIAGILFWLLFIPSPPARMRMPPEGQAIALVATNVIMWLLAMSMSFLTQTSWYPVYDHIAGVTLPAFADQQIGAGILWVCGDFWAIPALIIAIRRVINSDGSIGAALDKMIGKQSGTSGWASRAGR